MSRPLGTGKYRRIIAREKHERLQRDRKPGQLKHFGENRTGKSRWVRQQQIRASTRLPQIFIGLLKVRN
jgi:hypothetical protein